MSIHVACAMLTFYLSHFIFFLVMALKRPDGNSLDLNPKLLMNLL